MLSQTPKVCETLSNGMQKPAELLELSDITSWLSLPFYMYYGLCLIMSSYKVRLDLAKIKRLYKIKIA